MARSVNDRIHDLITNRQIDLIQAANHQAAEILGGPMRVADEKLIAVLSTAPENLTPARLKRIEDRIAATLAIQERIVKRSLRGYAQELTRDELEMMLAALQRVFGRLELDVNPVSVADAFARVRSAPIRGVPISRVLQRFFRNDRERVMAAIRAGASDGLSAEAIRRAVVGTQSRRFMDGVRQVSRRSVEAITQTVTTHATTQTRQVVFEANSELISEERWVSTLDSRTSPICQSLDGRVFPVGKGPHPPAHPNCRSGRMPIVPGLRALPVDPEIQTILPATVADSFDGKGPEVLTYPEWLRRQPQRVQRRVLGPTRFALFQTGEIGPRGFVNDRGRRLTIDELRARHRDLFEEAGLLDDE